MKRRLGMYKVLLFKYHVHFAVASLLLAPLFLDCEQSLFSSKVRGEERGAKQVSVRA